MALWFFQRLAPGEIRRLSTPAMQRFLVGEQALPQDGDGFVRCIGMSVALERRKPSHVARMWFSKIRVGEDGRVDPHHRPETLRLAHEQQEAGAEPTVIPATHHFARRRLSHLAEWRPEQRDLDALRSLVNGKAGREML